MALFWVGVNNHHTGLFRSTIRRSEPGKPHHSTGRNPNRTGGCLNFSTASCAEPRSVCCYEGTSNSGNVDRASHRGERRLSNPTSRRWLSARSRARIVEARNEQAFASRLAAAHTLFHSRSGPFDDHVGVDACSRVDRRPCDGKSTFCINIRDFSGSSATHDCNACSSVAGAKGRPRQVVDRG